MESNDSDMTRRTFVQAAASVAAVVAAARALGLSKSDQETHTLSQVTKEDQAKPMFPVILASGNGLLAVTKAAELIQAGTEPLEAIVSGANIVEADPKDQSVGFGGLPNEDGVVECDACVMDGPLHRAGAVAALQNTIPASRVAKLVMERTDHVLLVGEGALKFARAHGFGRDAMLTEESRQAWLQWKEKHSQEDNWLPPHDTLKSQSSRSSKEPPFTYGTYHCGVVDAVGNCYGLTTTSGRAYKLAGRVGDSPIIGAGCYVDNEVGVAGGTGRGEAAITDCAAYAILERIRAGRSPTDACLDVLKRVADHNRVPRLRDKDGRPAFDLTLYALRKDGAFGSAGIWSKGTFAVHAQGKSRVEPSAYLYEREG